MNDEINRRDFIRRAGLTTVSVSMAAAGLVASRRVLGANDRVRVGVIGTDAKGGTTWKTWPGNPTQRLWRSATSIS